MTTDSYVAYIGIDWADPVDARLLVEDSVLDVLLDSVESLPGKSSSSSGNISETPSRIEGSIQNSNINSQNFLPTLSIPGSSSHDP